MDRGLAVVATAAAGGLIAAQAPMNGRLGSVIGSGPAATVNFVVGLLALSGLLIATGKAGAFGDVKGAGLPWWCFVGGLMGATYVMTAAASVGALGAGGVTAATIAGQLTVSAVVDQLGLLGVEREPITLEKLAGIALLAAGVYLMVRE